MDGFNLVAALVSFQSSALGLSELAYLIIVAAIVLISFASLLHPFVNLAVVMFYLATANTYILGTTTSAAISTLLIGNCLLGTLLVSGFNLPVERRALLPAILLSAIAASGAMYGLIRGNHLLLVLGDFYQMIEFALLFILTQVLVKTEQQFRVMTNVLICSIVVTSALRIVDVLTGASYLSTLHLARQDGDDLLRTINMNAPVGFVALLAALPLARTKLWMLAGLAIVEISLILSFARGLWLATFAGAAFLLIVLHRSRGAVFKFGLAAAAFAIAFLFVTGLETVAVDRLGYTIVQWRSVPQEKQATTAQKNQPSGAVHAAGGGPGEEPLRDAPEEEKQVLAGRRRLEYILLLPEVAERPIIGAGLGSTYKISGDAVLEGPKGETIDNHYVHDLYLQIAFRLGIPALLSFLAGLGAYLWRAVSDLRTLDLSPTNAALVSGLIAAIFGDVILSLTSPIFLNHPTAGVTGCIMAMTLTILRLGAQQPARVDVGYGPDKALL
jgi:hypothetical protein